MAPVVQAAQVRAQGMIQVATIKEQGAGAVQQAKDQTALQINQSKDDRDREYNQALAQESQQNAQVDLEKLAVLRNTADLNYRLALMEFSEKRGISLDTIKADLASTSAKLQTEERIALANLTHGKAPPDEAPMEPAVMLPGRAGNGQAFAQTGGSKA